jgi:autotransporter translocation and assembly factor TamB
LPGFALLCWLPFDILRPVKKLSLILALLVALSLAAYAATNVSGTWNATVDLGGQGGSPTFVLKQDGEKLTGNYTGALGDAALTGTVKGDKISFDFDVQGNKIHYEGTVNADGAKMEGTCDYGGQASGTFKATKAEKKPEK